MKITHNKEHCFLAIWALQQYGGVADAVDDENDDRGAKKKPSSRTGHLPKELVRKIVGYLLKCHGHNDYGIAIQNLELEFDLAEEGDVTALRLWNHRCFQEGRGAEPD